MLVDREGKKKSCRKGVRSATELLADFYAFLSFYLNGMSILEHMLGLTCVVLLMDAAAVGVKCSSMSAEDLP